MERNESINIDSTLVSHLINKQFPQWKNLVVKPVAVGGWDNRTFHLGNKMLVRLPSAAEYAPKVKKEQKWLPRLAPFLPLKIPTLLAIGEPDENYPWPWSVYSWIEGENAATGHITNLDDFATSLSEFITALHRIDSTDGPIPNLGGFAYIGGLAVYDDEARQAFSLLKDKIDTTIAIKAWEAGIKTIWQHPPLWVHGDITAGNLLVNHGKLTAVIDFGGLAVGDPACDLVIAWKFFKSETRKTFRNKLPLDNATWARGRAWALWKASIVAANLTETNAIEAANPLGTINEVLMDYKHNL
ncbi:MAG: aminoglycoside phosphotransferase [Caedibacter sp. 37-49]|nr:MAG: aminoglycoside phosphotransferase [Caedibacter sp. 37-49]